MSMTTRRMPRVFTMSLLVAATVLLAACGVDTSGNPSAAGTHGWSVVDEETWQETLRFSLWVSSDSITPGEVLEVRTEVENLTDQEVPYTIVSKGGPPITTSLTSPFGSVIYPRLTSDTEVGAQPGTVSMLNPRELMRQEATWDATIPASGDHLPVPNGVYTLHAHLVPGDPPVERWKRLELSHDIQVTGSYANLLSPEEALDAAQDAPEIEAWLDEHRGEAVAKREGGEYLVLQDDLWVPATRETYEQARAQVPGTNLQLTLDGWEVILGMAPFGRPPHQVSVLLDHETGEVLRLEWIYPESSK
jgi:hypothetical protein